MPPPKEKQILYSVIIGGEVHNVTGRYRNASTGYVVLRIKSHPNSSKERGCVLEHRVMMEMHLGRYLSPDEIVHHINEIKHDNRIFNLQVMTHGEHTIKHHKGKKMREDVKDRMAATLKMRFQNKELHPMYKKIDKDILVEILKEHGATKAAKLLNVSRKTIYNKIKEFNL